MADLKSTAELTNTLSFHENVSPSSSNEKNAHQESAVDSTIYNAKLATDKLTETPAAKGVSYVEFRRQIASERTRNLRK
jgi:hypothetical protein